MASTISTGPSLPKNDVLNFFKKSRSSPDNLVNFFIVVMHVHANFTYRFVSIVMLEILLGLQFHLEFICAWTALQFTVI
jgi:hypothetical protein